MTLAGYVEEKKDKLLEFPIAIWGNMDRPWKYHATQSKSDRKRQGPYDFTHRWDVKQKATNEQTKQTKKTQTQTTVLWLAEGKVRRVKRVKYMVMEGDLTLR